MSKVPRALNSIMYTGDERERLHIKSRGEIRLTPGSITIRHLSCAFFGCMLAVDEVKKKHTHTHTCERENSFAAMSTDAEEKGSARII